jgi:hypothetical protein
MFGAGKFFCKPAAETSGYRVSFETQERAHAKAGPVKEDRT